WARACSELSRVVAQVQGEGILVYGIAVVHQEAARRLAFDLANKGVRVFAHTGGRNAADLELLVRLEAEVPGSCGTVIIASGDGIFAGSARLLRRAGRRVAVLARPG